MASSDDEGETFPDNVSEYEFVDGEDDSISFAELPVEWDVSSSSDKNADGRKQRKIFLLGKTDNGLRTLYKKVVAWKFDLSSKKPEISVKAAEGYWIKLLKPRKAFETIIRTVLVTVHFLHFIKSNPRKSGNALWDHLSKSFSTWGSRPCEGDLVDHISLINEAVKRDESLKKSELVDMFLAEKPRKRKASDEVLMPKKRKASNEDSKDSFIVDDISDNDEQEADKTDKSEEDDDDDEDDSTDSVCAICDNGGDLIVCEGKCMRSFHATKKHGEDSRCASLGFTEKEYEAILSVAFYCKNCQDKQHQCFACGELGSSDESSGAEVFCCVNEACGHFYHPECVSKLLHPGDQAAAEDHKQKIASGEPFLCPVHRCHVCLGDESSQFAVCRRCPGAYHRKCLPRDIAFKQDVRKGRAKVPRAWENLIRNRILIYCLKHEIDANLLTPVRDHIKFPGLQQKQKRNFSPGPTIKELLKERNSASEDITWKRISAKPSKRVEKPSSSAKDCELPRKRVAKLPGQASSKKQKVALKRNSVGKANETRDGGNRLDSTCHSGDDPEPMKSGCGERVHCGPENTQEVKPKAERIDHSFKLDADSKKRILELMKEASSSVTLQDIKEKLEAASTHAETADNITLEKVEGAVQAVRAAIKNVEDGDNVDAKAVNNLLGQMEKWKEELEVHLAPFLYGSHSVKVDKLKEVSSCCPANLVKGRILYQKDSLPRDNGSSEGDKNNDAGKGMSESNPKPFHGKLKLIDQLASGDNHIDDVVKRCSNLFPPDLTEPFPSPNKYFPGLSGGQACTPGGSPDCDFRAVAEMRIGSHGLNSSANTYHGTMATFAAERYASGSKDSTHNNGGGLNGFPGPSATSSNVGFGASIKRPFPLGYAPDNFHYPRPKNNGGGWIDD